MEQKSEENNASVSQKQDTQKIVLTGDLLCESKEILPGYGTYRVGDKVYSKYVGVASQSGSVMHVIPLSGAYIPKVGDYVIGEIKDVAFSFWSVEINSPYTAVMSSMDTQEFIPKAADLSRFFTNGDLALFAVSAVTKNKYVNVSMKDAKCRKLIGGMVIQMTASKIPRLIGKEGSMITLIKNKTRCFITAGQNGLVWIKGEYDDMAVEAVRMVDKYAPTSGLTERVEKFLNEALAKMGVSPDAQASAQAEPLSPNSSDASASAANDSEDSKL